MTDKNIKPQVNRLAEDEAVFWFSKMNGSPSFKDRVAFEKWLALVPENAWAFAEIEDGWQSLDRATLADSVENSDDLVTKSLLRITTERHRRKTRTLRSATTSICLFFALGGVWFWLTQPTFLQDIQADYVASRGERKTIVLEDGSSVDLDAGSAIKVSFDENLRSVRLLRGQAFFEVKKDRKPFVVAAAGGQSQVLGTSFAVSLEEDRVEVALAQGSLVVTAINNKENQSLSSGQSVTYNSSSLSSVKPVDLSKIASWRQDRLTFSNEPLQNVLKRLQRYRTGRVVIYNSDLGERRITGSVSLADADATLASLAKAVGFNATKITGYLTVLTTSRVE